MIQPFHTSFAHDVTLAAFARFITMGALIAVAARVSLDLLSRLSLDIFKSFAASTSLLFSFPNVGS